MEQTWLIPEARPELKREAKARGYEIVRLTGFIDGAPDEVDSLRYLIEEVEYFIKRATAGWKRELAQLRNVGPLPPDIADRLKLTVDGQRTQRVH